MCGIAGILRLTEAKEIAGEDNTQQVIALLRHRGPDGEGVYAHRNVKLFHTRLRIIDTSSASAQPFRYTNEEDALVFNGEIFNYRELGAHLGPLKTSGDVEVLYRLLREDGMAALAHLNGFFAFAYYDAGGGLLLARDRFGVKPLYYYRDKEKFVFSSELRPLLELAGPQELNPNQLYTYFRLNYCAGNETIFRNVYRLMPGEALRIEDGKITREQWYKVGKPDPSAKLYDLLDDAVRLRLRADVPCGTFLSGGLDSSIISALAAKQKPGLKTFSIGFSENKFLDESVYARRVARHIGSDHHEILLSETDFLEQVDHFLDAVDEPFADSSAFNLFLLARYSREHIKVALSGDGADELFKGYRKHRAFMLSGNAGGRMLSPFLKALFAGAKSSRSGALSNTKRQVDKFAMMATLPHEERIKFLASISTHQECSGLLAEGVSSIYFDALFRESAMMPDLPAEDRFDIQHVLADDMLVKVDRFSMRQGLEVRNPFLDYRVMEYALSLPLSDKINARGQKRILRRTFSHLLPGDIVNRPKKGFELPLEKWLKHDLRSRIEKEWLSKERIMDDHIFSYGHVAGLKAQLWSSSPGDAPAKIWALIVFQHWIKHYRKYITGGRVTLPAGQPS